MSLALIGRSASYEFRWRRWALLRDTALLLAGPAMLPRLHAIGDGLVGPTRLPAALLTQDIEQLRSLLRGKTTDALAISPKTAAVLYMGAKLSEPRLLSAAERMQIAPARDGTDLAEYFASMLDSIVEVCRHPLDDGCVEIIDG